MMKNVRYRKKRFYDPSGLTTHHLAHLLPKILSDIGKTYKDRPDLVLASWPEVIGPRLVSMTEAKSFIEGVLTVVVKNSTLYSLLAQTEKPKLLKNLREKFPGMTIKTIRFRMG
ncbi:MAG: DUF721 domain-containing protein [Chlamydiia bacterium]|nr:DUF721 domain-containing protein [Chlamydiia bacterium]